MSLLYEVKAQSVNVDVISELALDKRESSVVVRILVGQNCHCIP